MHLKTNIKYLLLALVLFTLGRVHCKTIKETDDQKQFRCGEGKFECSSETCIPILYQCDGDDDCDDGSDEVGCAPTTPAPCRPDTEFTCRNNKCIPSRWVCDKENDCSDNSDEDTCATATCKPNYFQCNNSRCIPARWKCDGQEDCRDNSDEIGCPIQPCRQDEEFDFFQCGDGSCIYEQWVCNGEEECSDGTDEKECPAKITCSTSQFNCNGNRCIPNTWHCDGTPDCNEDADERDCLSTKSPPCRPDFWMCENGECIEKEWQCDGEADCDDESDEHECSKVQCAADRFKCKNGRQCVFKSVVCDAHQDCDDGSDEENCEPVTLNCGTHHFNCSNGTCIDQSKLCDLKKDCAEGEDEPMNCFINECNDFNGHCMHQCNDKKSGYECSCLTGYKLSSDKHSCEDIDECSVYGMCHQHCENTKGSYKCSCADGYLLEPNRKSCKAVDAVGWVYFANRHEIRRISTDRSDFSIAVENCSGVMSFDFHTSQNKIFWADIVSQTIHSATIDKHSTKTVIMKNVHTPDGLAVDWISGKLYWTDTRYKTIEVSDLNGNHNMDLVDVGLAEPRAVALNPHVGYIYWTDCGKYAAIERMSMDGELSTRKKLITENIVWPIGLTLDLPQERMYWIDAKLSRIESADLDGNHRVIVKQIGTTHQFALDNFEDMLYWTDWSQFDGVKSISKFNTTVTKILHSGFYKPMDIKVLHPARQKHETDPCGNNNFGCSHLCLLANHYEHRMTACRCPRNMTLDSTLKKCIGMPATRSPKSKTTGTKPSTSATSMISQSTRTKILASSTAKPLTKKSSSSASSTKTIKRITPNVVVGKHTSSGSTSMSSGSIAAIALSLIILIVLVVLFIIFIRRRNVGKGHVMFYKDISTAPLEDDFDMQDPMDDEAKIISDH